MLITPDFSEVRDSISAGTYKVRVVAAEPGEWSTGTKFVNWHLETFGESEAKNNGRRVYYRTPIAGKGAFRLADMYQAAMKTPLSAGTAIDTEVVLGKELTAVVVEGVDREGNPTGYPEVKAVRPL